MPLARGRRETPDERADRSFVELLQELRVTQTGVQLLTGFLLTLPFQPRFADLDDVQVGIYLTLVVLAATTTMLVVAPVSLHRFLFQRRLKSELVRTGHRLAMAGLICLGLVVVGTVLLVFDVVLDRGVAVAVAGGVFALVAVAWIVLPLLYRRTGRTNRDGEEDEQAEEDGGEDGARAAGMT